MKGLLIAMISLVCFFGVPAIAGTVTEGVTGEIFEHGGGCRKNSPAGMCCHKNHKTGVVHCH
ncbi:MAG: hypothetical protein RPV21_01385 [Candidatus Sedimenticola sp. (ex Thyasira tokunagai)]